MELSQGHLNNCPECFLSLSQLVTLLKCHHWDYVAMLYLQFPWRFFFSLSFLFFPLSKLAFCRAIIERLPLCLSWTETLQPHNYKAFSLNHFEIQTCHFQGEERGNDPSVSYISFTLVKMWQNYANFKRFPKCLVDKSQWSSDKLHQLKILKDLIFLGMYHLKLKYVAFPPAAAVPLQCCDCHITPLVLITSSVCHNIIRRIVKRCWHQEGSQGLSQL